MGMTERRAKRKGVDSLAVPLSQGLRSQDRALLDRCLENSQPKTIDLTVGNLSPADAGMLLDIAVDRLEMKHGHRQTLVNWIRAVLLRHTAYLMSSGGQQQTLSKLQHIIDEQTQLIQPLSMLSGRLELLLAQTEPLPVATAPSNADVVMADAKQDVKSNASKEVESEGEEESEEGEEESEEDDDDEDEEE